MNGWLRIQRAKKLVIIRLQKLNPIAFYIIRWTGVGGTTGTSINIFDKTDSTWNQIWVDNQRNILRLKSDLAGKKMVLKSDLVKPNKAELYRTKLRGA